MNGPRVAEANEWAAAWILAAAVEQWPAARVQLERGLASVTNYVWVLRVAHADAAPELVCAKFNVCGVSVTSILRGACGDLAAVADAQARYLRCGDTVLSRQAGQLAFLARLGRPRVPAVLGVRHGVMFTRYVSTEDTLAGRLVADPTRARELLEVAWSQVARLHRIGSSAAAPVLDTSTHIPSIFDRKFTGNVGAAYLAGLGEGWFVGAELAALRERLAGLVARLAARPAVVNGDSGTVAYGDFKPEHVLHGVGGPPVFVDPGLQRGGPLADAAKLVSRVVLLILDTSPEPAAAILAGLEGWLVGLLPRQLGEAWLRALLWWWLMDTINITSTYLSLPPGTMALPDSAAVVAMRADAVCGLVDAVTSALVGNHSPTAALQRGLEAASCAARR